MADFRTILKVENNSPVQYSLKDLFSSLVDEPKRYPCGTNRRHYFLFFESLSSAEHAFSHRRDLADVSVLPVHSCPVLIEQHKEEMDLLLSSRVYEGLLGHGITAKSVTGPARTESVSLSNTPFGSIDGKSLVLGPRLYAHSSAQDPQNAHRLALDKIRGASIDSIASSVQDDSSLESPLHLQVPSTGQSKGSGIALLSTGPSDTAPLTCESRISLTICGEIITYDLKSEPSDPNVVIELLKATKSERGNYMIAGAFYRRMGHPGSSKAVLMSMLEEFSSQGVSPDCLRSAFLLLSGCELDMARMNKAATKNASAHYAAAQTWLQKVFGKSKVGNVSARQKENRPESRTARNAADNRICTCSGEGVSKPSSRDISRMEREIQSLRDRNTNQQNQLFNLRSSKRKLEDDFFYERDMRRKYQRRLEDLERDHARKMEVHASERTKMEADSTGTH